MKIYNRATRITLETPTIFDDIGNPGELGFGVGVASIVPADITPMPGFASPSSDNYGNYMTNTGSQRVYIPAFWYRIAHASNPTYATYGVNSVDTKKYSYFADEVTANASGYAMHRMFWDGGIIQKGVFVDKYKCSNLNGVACSVKGGKPISTTLDHNPINGLTGITINAHYSAIDAAKLSSIGAFCTTRFITAGLALLSLAHGQASSAATYCAWYSAGATNFPKGCNNNALRDVNDTAVAYQTDGYSTCGKTGSAGYGGGVGNTFAKTTHNGQNCGVADLNGLMYEINPGLTCITSTKAITGISQANPAVVTSVAHGLTNGAQIMITGVVGMTQVNSTIATVANATADTFELQGVDSTAYTAYTSGGTMTFGTFYTYKNATAAKTLTAGNTLSTDVWGATGVAAHSDVIAIPFADGSQAKFFGNAANQVISEATAGDPWKLAGLGFPKDANGVSAAASSLFGNDYFYQQFTNELVPLSCLGQGNFSNAGVWGVYLANSRSDAISIVGFRSACYPV